jgi:ribokinase
MLLATAGYVMNSVIRSQKKIIQIIKNNHEVKNLEKILVFGNFVAGITARAPHFPEPGETVKGNSFRIYPGGKGFSQAVAARRAGGDVLFSTKLGRDNFAELCTSMMREEKMEETYLYYDETIHTSASLVTVNEETKQNCITLTLGACERITVEETDKLLPELSKAGYLLMQLGVNVDAVYRMAKAAAEKGVKVVLNPAPAVPLDEAYYPYFFCVTPNESETKALTGIYPDSAESCKAAAGYFKKRGVKNICITLGKHGVYVSDGNSSEIIPNYDLPVLDTTGAGDCFSGCLTCALAEGKTLFDAAKFANAASNIIVTRIGTTPFLPYREEIERLLATGKME